MIDMLKRMMRAPILAAVNAHPKAVVFTLLKGLMSRGYCLVVRFDASVGQRVLTVLLPPACAKEESLEKLADLINANLAIVTNQVVIMTELETRKMSEEREGDLLGWRDLGFTEDADYYCLQK